MVVLDGRVSSGQAQQYLRREHEGAVRHERGQQRLEVNQHLRVVELRAHQGGPQADGQLLGLHQRHVRVARDGKAHLHQPTE